jgi:hypothetical protein
MYPNREGRFKATIKQHGITESGSSKLAAFACEFALIEELINGQWTPIHEDLSITGYFYLEKRDGSLNTIRLDMVIRFLFIAGPPDRQSSPIAAPRR